MFSSHDFRVIVATAFFALALLSISCGGGGGSTALAPVSTAGISTTPTTVTFGNQSVGTSSAAQSVTLTSTGNAALTISSITATGDFTQTNNCATSVPAGNNCTVNVIFIPTATGTRSGSLNISDNAAGSPQTVTLTGTGVTAGPAASLAPTDLTFSSQIVGSTSGGQTLTLTNTGNASLTITSLAITGTNASDFAQTNNCGSSVGAGANCTINVTFTPSASGSRAASVTITDNATGSPQTVALTGTGTATAATASLTPASLTFASQAVGSSSSAEGVTLTNTGNATLTISSLAVTGANATDFAQTNNCGSSVAAGANCTISVTFTPSASGSRAASVTITDNATGSPQTVRLSGTGATTGAVVSLSSTSLAFGNQPVQMTSSAQTVTLTNTGGTTLSITSLNFTGTNASDFAETDTCGGSVAAGANCTIGLLFTPSATGARTAALSISDNASGSPQTVSLSGTGSHDVILSWTGSTTPGVMGYYVYRGTTSGGESSTPLNSTPINGTTYTDENVTAGAAYYYVVTAVASNGVTQSAASNEAGATIP